MMTNASQAKRRGFQSLLAIIATAPLAFMAGCSGGDSGGVEIADPSKTPAPVAGGVPEGYKPTEVVIE